ncbi:hypothetical protein [Mucilaginibacter sp. NFX135]|jgi:hypothetical protein|uniref:hypothetical protein n=1 Tax=Mucilaginibacter sp. NFX135 TaxID=3402687 RepID=UPI003AFA7B7A
MSLIINLIFTGGLLGVLGQGIRILAGLKKLSNSNVANTVTGEPTNEFSASRLLISIFIGFVAGAIALLIKSNLKPVETDAALVTTIIAAGYSGADFIESVFNTATSKFNADLPKKQALADRQRAALLADEHPQH